MKVSKTELTKMIKEALKENMKLREGVSSLQKDVMPGSGEMSKLAEEVDKLLMDTSKNAKELVEKLESEMKIDMLGGEGKPGMAPRVGERNRMLMNRISILKRLSSAAVSMMETLRKEG